VPNYDLLKRDSEKRVREDKKEAGTGGRDSGRMVLEHETGARFEHLLSISYVLLLKKGG